MTTSLCSARSSSVSTCFAPASVSGFALSGVRFHTVTVWPTSISRAATAAPMRPSPAIPICISALSPPVIPAERTRGPESITTESAISHRPSHLVDSCGYGFRARRFAALRNDGGTMERKGQVGVIGLGIMGGAIAKNLAAAGWQVIGFDIAKERCDEANTAGVEIAADAAVVAAKATNILVSLPKPGALMATVEAIAQAKLPRRVIAELSTFSLDDKTEAQAALRAAGHVMLDCPLSGTGAPAR